MSFLFRPTPQLVRPEDAFPGRDHPVLEHPAPHAVLGTPITGPWMPYQKEIVVGMGCFWGAEKLLWQTPGIESTAVGYAGGVTRNPTYREVCSGQTNHTEVVRVVYNPGQITYARIIALMFEAHDPTQGFRQGNDVGTQYRSAVYPVGDTDTAADEVALALEIAGRFEKRLHDAGLGAITTEIMPLADTPAGEFYLAEDYHQQYLYKNPGGYCPSHSTGVKCEV